jgi:hypothetical protein
VPSRRRGSDSPAAASGEEDEEEKEDQWPKWCVERNIAMAQRNRRPVPRTLLAAAIAQPVHNGIGREEELDDLRYFRLNLLTTPPTDLK